MKRKTGSVSKMLALSGWAALMVSAAALASSEEEVLERIRPIGKVNVAQPAAPAAPAPAAAEAPSATPAPAPAAAPPAPAPAAQPAAAAPAAMPTPVAGQPAPAEPAAAPAGDGDAVGKKTYDTVCFVCHMAGVSNAPKLGDKAAWEPRIAKGLGALLQSSINGIPGTAMPPRGTCAACTDEDLKAAVQYMVSQVQ